MRARVFENDGGDRSTSPKNTSRLGVRACVRACLRTIVRVVFEELLDLSADSVPLAADLGLSEEPVQRRSLAAHSKVHAIRGQLLRVTFTQAPVAWPTHSWAHQSQSQITDLHKDWP
jgi:hypothetical protein